MIEIDNIPRNNKPRQPTQKFNPTLREFLGFANDHNFLDALYMVFKVSKIICFIVLMIILYLTMWTYVREGAFMTTRLALLYAIAIGAIVVSRFLELYFKFRLEIELEQNVKL